MSFLKNFINFFLKFMRFCEKGKGFTLVEAVLGLVIFVVGIVAVQRVLISSLSAVSVIENWTYANQLLGKKTWETEQNVQQGRGTSFPHEHAILSEGKHVYESDLSTLAITPDNLLVEAKLGISWKDGGIHKSLSRNFYILRPYDHQKTSGF